MPAEDILEFRLLGEMQVLRGGQPVALPPSKKTRALLAYLLVTGRPQRRDRLCELLWDLTEDPRGALRWSLSRLRQVVDGPAPRLLADRERVSLELEGARVDLLTVRAGTREGLSTLPTERLQTLSELYRGELLDGLNLAEFQEFSAWCVAERESARKLHARILAALVERLEVEPESALRHARRLKRIDPFNESVRARLVRLLVAAGRPMEAQEQYRAAARALHEAGIAPSGELMQAYRAVRESVAAAVEPATAPAPAHTPADPPEPPVAAPLVGRDEEWAAMRAALGDVAAHRRSAGILLSGEPGVGKSRLLSELLARARDRGARIVEGCCYEPERRRPFGPWIDALRRLPEALLTPPRRAALGPLLPGGEGGIADAGGHDRLLADVARVLAEMAADAPLLVLAFDDVQWLDDASATLVHYVCRSNRDAALLLALAARRGELQDVPEVQRVIQALRRADLLQEHRLAPLTRGDTARLVDAIAPGSDAARVFTDSGGNPLFAIELARALARGGTAGDLPGSYADIVRDRIDRLPEEAVEVLRWGCVCGTLIRLEVLEALPRFDLERLAHALDTLERHGLLQAVNDPDHPRGAYRFAHDLVRRVVLADLSNPRRRLIHLQIAKALEQLADPSGDAASELADHAARGGDAAMAARACVAAARRCLRVFANTEAEALARRGMRYAETLDDPERVTLMLELTQARLYARRPRDRAEVARAVEVLAERALDHGCLKHARLGFYLLSLLRWESGDWADARRFSVRVEELGRDGSEHERVLALGTTGQCLVLLERDLPEAEAMLMEAAALGERAGHMPAVVLEAQGMLRLHAGDLDEAATLLARARDTARRDGERLGEFNALEHLVALELQRDACTEAVRLSAELLSLGERFRGGSEAPFARAVHALVRHAAGEVDQVAALDEALDALRREDAKHRLAWVLSRCARIDLARGDAGGAARRAAEALDTARALGRGSEEVMALATCALAAQAGGDAATARTHLDAMDSPHLAQASAEARRAAAAARAACSPQDARAGVAP